MFKGIIVPNITFFDSDGNIDLLSCEKHMKWLREKGISILFLTGSYGSGPLMNNAEKLELYKVAYSIPGLEFIANIGGIETRQSAELLNETEKIGINKFASCVPYYYKYTHREVLHYFECICGETKGDVFVYNNTNVTRFRVTSNMIGDLASCGVKGIKDSSLDIDLASCILYEESYDFQYIAGSSTGCLGLYKMGVQAFVAGMANYAPELVVGLYEEMINGDINKAKRFYEYMMLINRKVKIIDSTILCNAVLRMRGFKEIFVRSPMKELDENSEMYQYIQRTLVEIYEKLGLLWK